MDPKKKDRLEKKGWRVGSAEDFLGLTGDEAALVTLHLEETDETTDRSESCPAA